MITFVDTGSPSVIGHFEEREILYAFHDIDGTHSLIRDWPPVMSIVLHYVSENGVPDGYDSDEQVKKLVSLAGTEPLPETDSFCIESAGLSALTQKKGALTEAEYARLDAHPLVWGCDTCQLACPVTKAARAAGTLYSRIPFFNEAAIPHLTADRINAMSEAEFHARAYSWRGRAVILRNLALFESNGKGEPL